MTMTGNGNPTPGPETAPPQIKFLGQYIKDLSFENPNAPRVMAELKQQPAINVQINVNGRLLANTDYEVEIRIESKAEIPGTTIFALDLLYAGVFRLENIPPDNINPVVMIECPRLLFPFAREIIASTVMHGGFPSLLLDPIDFVALYQQRMAQASQATPAQA